MRPPTNQRERYINTKKRIILLTNCISNCLYWISPTIIGASIKCSALDESLPQTYERKYCLECSNYQMKRKRIFYAKLNWKCESKELLGTAGYLFLGMHYSDKRNKLSLTRPEKPITQMWMQLSLSFSLSFSFSLSQLRSYSYWRSAVTGEES